MTLAQQVVLVVSVVFGVAILAATHWAAYLMGQARVLKQWAEEQRRSVW